MDKFIQKKCKTHGETEFVLEGRGYYRCKRCRSEQVSARRKRVVLTLKLELGGKCQFCGYNNCMDALEFHHKDPKQKKFLLSRGHTYSLEKLRAEVKKCVLLCANHHREVEAGIITISDGEIGITQGC